MSERRPCILGAADRKMIRYRSRRPPDVELRTRLRDLANQRRRFGYRRLFILLREQGEPSGVNRIYRLYREEGLSKRKARRRAVGTRTPILVEAKVNARWSLDFVHDQFAQGRRFRILNIVDDVTRECLAAIPDTSISGKRVARELFTALIDARGKRQMIVSDNGISARPWSFPGPACRWFSSSTQLAPASRAPRPVFTIAGRSVRSGPPRQFGRGCPLLCPRAVVQDCKIRDLLFLSSRSASRAGRTRAPQRRRHDPVATPCC
jgi:transposase InsO family protein